MTDRADRGGETGVNGYRYKGGQFLPSTDAPPGTWRVRIKGRSKVIGSRVELIEPGRLENSPTPFSRSIFTLINPIVLTGDDGKLTVNDRLPEQTIEYYGRNIRPGVNGVFGTATYDVEELVNLYNQGMRWIDVTLPDVEVMTKF